MTHKNRSKDLNRPGAVPRPSQIRAAREAANLTQTACAEMVFVAMRTWQKWESEVEGDTRTMPANVWQLWRLKVQARAADVDQTMNAISIAEELRQ